MKASALLLILGNILSNLLQLSNIDVGGRHDTSSGIDFDAAWLNTYNYISAASSTFGSSLADTFTGGSKDREDGRALAFHDEQTYERQLQQSLRPMPNATTGANYYKFYSGLCNEYEMFIGYAVILVHEQKKLDQILVDPLVWKDLFGTGEFVPHAVLWDVVHWNSYYPRLPKMVSYHQAASVQEAERMFPDIYFDKETGYMNWATDDPQMNATRPHAVGKGPRNFVVEFHRYTKQVRLYRRSEPFEAEKLVAQGALRPHPTIRKMIDAYLEEFKSKQQRRVGNAMGSVSNAGSSNGVRYAVLHARVEPDMTEHPVCRDKKVILFSEIMDGIYRNITAPAFTDLILFFNREMLEAVAGGGKGKLTGRSAKISSTGYEIAATNLKEINRVVEEGMWNGQVRVHEAGSEFAKAFNHSVYSKYSTLTGQIINLHLALDSEVFIGTELSSYSGVVVSTRFYRENRKNYFYQPQGLVEATPEEAEVPPRFQCSF